MDQFLYHDAAERERLLDLTMRLRPLYALCVAVMAVPAGFGISVYGWHATVPLALSTLVYAACNVRLERRRRPELLLFGSSVFALLMILLSIWLADGPKEYLFCMPTFALLGMAPIFARRVSVTVAILTCVAVILVAFGSYSEAVLAFPPMIIMPIILMLITVHVAVAGRNAETVNRGTAVVDPLTGLHNRVALESRVTELAHHAGHSGEQVGFLIADLDHFKAINDEHGHAVGDAVLVEIAARLRAVIGPGGLIYRFGGEEFVVIVPGTTALDAEALAERLRTVVRSEPIEGLFVTASFGVALSFAGERFDYRSLFVRADSALYRAKASGRDRVCADDGAGIIVRDDVIPRPGAAHGASTLADAASGSVAQQAGKPRRRRKGPDSTFLARDGIERAHMLDVVERSRVDGKLSSAVMMIGLTIGGFWTEWWLLIPPVLAGVIWEGIADRLPKARRPEFAGLAGLALIVVAGGLAGLLSDPLVLFGLPLMSSVILGSSAGLNRAGVVILAGTAAATVTVTGLLIDATAIAANPVILAFPIALIVSNAIIGGGLGGSAREHRLVSITDSLTGTLNRGALEARIPELALAVDVPTSMLVLDIDHFKRVNDERGHGVGDAVLVEVAQRVRGALRAYDSVYRVGGEEFVVVLAGTPGKDAGIVAERVRRAVESTPISRMPITISIGTSSAEVGEPFNYERTFSAADRRLYLAKQNGRNQVVTSGPGTEPERELAAAA